MNQRIVFRADGNKMIGFGHLYRLLALADMLKDNFTCVFIINHPDEIIKNRIAGICELIELEAAYTYTIPDLISEANQMPYNLGEMVNKNDIVVLDGYHFLQQYQQGLQNTGCKQVFVDDRINEYPFADMIINHAPGIVPGDYKTKARFCLGLDYALLRKPFFSSFQTKHTGHVYVSMGGSDLDGYTLLVCKALLQIENIGQIHVLCSDQFDTKQLEQLKALEQQYNLDLYFNLDAHQIVDVLSLCTSAVVASSTVMIEAYSRGLICYAGYTSENQLHLYHGFVKNGFVKGLGDLKQLSTQKIAEAIEEIVDVKNLASPLQSVNAYQKAFYDLAYGNA